MNILLLKLKEYDVQMDFRPTEHGNGMLVIFTKRIHNVAHILDFDLLADTNNNLPDILYGYLGDFLKYIIEKEKEN